MSIIYYVQHKSRVSYPENNRHLNHISDLLMHDVAVSRDVSVVHTKEADYILCRYLKPDSSQLIITPNPRCGIVQPFGFKMDNIPDRLAIHFESLFSSLIEAQKKGKFSNTSFLPAALLVESRRHFKKSIRYQGGFDKLDYNCSVIQGFNNTDSKFQIYLSSEFEHFCRGHLKYIYAIERRLENKDIQTLELRVEQSPGNLTISGATTSADKINTRIGWTHEKPLPSYVAKVHKICEKACRIFSVNGPEEARKYLDLPFDKQNREIVDNPFVPPHKPSYDPVSKRNPASDGLLKKHLSPNLSEVIPGDGKNVFFTIRESSLKSAAVLEVCPSANWLYAKLQQVFYTDKAKDSLLKLMTSGKTVDYGEALNIIIRKGFTVKVSMLSGHSPMLRDIGKMVSVNYRDKLEFINTYNLTSFEDVPVRSADLGMLFIETLKGRHFIRISHTAGQASIADGYLPDMYIILDNDGCGEIRLENQDTRVTYPLKNAEAESKEFLLAKLKLFYESPYLLLNQLMQHELTLDAADRRLRRTYNESRILIHLPNNIMMNYAKCLYNEGAAAVPKLKHEIPKANDSEVFYTLSAWNTDYHLKMEFMITIEGISYVSIKDPSDAAPLATFSYQGIGLEEARKFYLEALKLFAAFNIITSANFSETELFKHLEKVSKPFWI